MDCCNTTYRLAKLNKTALLVLGATNLLEEENQCWVLVLDATKGAELGLKPEPLPAKDGGVEKEVVPAPGRLAKLLVGSARTDLEQSSDRGGNV